MKQSHDDHRDRITVALTGASGIPYALRLIQSLLVAGEIINVLVSPAARAVIAMETDLKLPSDEDGIKKLLIDMYGGKPEQLHLFGHMQWTAPMASGSSAPRAMVICPCTSGCVSAIANGSSDNLIERAADVVIKENKSLILVHRETPLSAIHLENLLKLARLGVTILPANPGFYHNPQTIADLVDFVEARILDHLHVPHTISQRW